MVKDTNRNRASLMNAASALMLTLVNGLLGIVVTRYVIAAFGSDFNGLNTTANQIVNVLLILEGGFTVASNVALFGPLTQDDTRLVNGILVATRKKFRLIGMLFLLVGTAVAVGYTFVVKSELPAELIFTILFMTVFPAAFNLFFATTYRVLLQAQQREYVISGITALTIGLGHITNIIMVTHGGKMWMVRLVTMLFSLANSFLIVAVVRHGNKFLDFKEASRGELIKGTNDVLVQKITGVVYNAAPIVFLSVSPAGGTVLASVYGVYNNVFTMIKSLLHSVIDAPRLGLGQMLSERKREELWDVFAQYEMLAFMAISVLLTTAQALILPFVKLYTSDIADTNYSDPVIAVMMVLIAAVEMIHIPSGHLINMAGEFRVSRNIQLAACIALLVSMSVGGILFGVYGMLAALLLVACLLAFLEMGYVHVRFFKKALPGMFVMLLPIAAVSVVLGFVETLLPVDINSAVSFILFGALFACVNFAAMLLFGFIFKRKMMMSVLHRIMHVLKK